MHINNIPILSVVPRHTSNITMLPQFSILHADVHPSPDILFPSPHCYKILFNFSFLVHNIEHPSYETLFPSSHSSQVSIMLLPHSEVFVLFCRNRLLQILYLLGLDLFMFAVILTLLPFVSSFKFGAPC